MRSERAGVQGLMWALLAVLALPAAHAATAFIGGEAVYRERILPPPGAVLVVTLEDVSRADAPSRELASVRRVIGSGPPYPWRLAYDPAVVERSRPGARHALRARIVDGDTLWMTTDTFTPAFGKDPKARPVLLLRRVAAPQATAAPPQAVPSPPAVPAPSLLGSWNLTHIGEQAVPPNTERPVAVAHLVFGADGRVSGSDGCNRLTGPYTSDGGSLQFGPLAGTRMACLGLNGRDDAFNRALATVTGWRVSGHTLELLAQGAPVLRFAPGGPK